MDVTAGSSSVADPRALLLASYRAAVAAADPLAIVPSHLPAPRAGGRTIVVGAGKAGGAMALAVERAWPQAAALEGLVITRYDHVPPDSPPGDERRIEIVEAAHPVPDANGGRAAARMLELVRSAQPSDQVIVLVSGGGSALLTLPAAGLGMADLRATTSALLASGAPIQDMNTVRKHLSAISGGQLAAACAAPTLALIISDVAGDEPTHIASGPCSPDPTTYADCIAILDRFSVSVPTPVRAHLERGLRGELPETPKPGAPLFDRVDARVIATAQRSLLAGAAVFEAAGVPAVVLSDSITGEAREVGQVLAAFARQVARYASPWRAPVALVSGGECTVTLRNAAGRGGRASEFLLGLGIAMKGLDRVYALAADTDGIDGSELNAGAFWAPDSLARATAIGLDAKKLLQRNDAYEFFSALGDLIEIGPTFTNVNDYRVVLLG